MFGFRDLSGELGSSPVKLDIVGKEPGPLDAKPLHFVGDFLPALGGVAYLRFKPCLSGAFRPAALFESSEIGAQRCVFFREPVNFYL